MPERKPYVFISYSSKNTAEAEKIRDLMHKNGLQSWMALHDIPAGARYAHVINEAIENCSCVLLLLTKEAQASDHVDREIERAASYKKEIVPMRLDRCELNSGFRYYIGSLQIMDVDILDETDVQLQVVMERLRKMTDIESEAFRWLLEGLKQWQNASKTCIVDPRRVILLNQIYENMVALLKEEGCDDYKVTIEPDPLEMGAVSFCIVCNDITITNVKAFCEIIQHFDNFEIYPLIDDKLRFAGVLQNVAHVSKNKE